MAVVYLPFHSQRFALAGLCLTRASKSTHHIVWAVVATRRVIWGMVWRLRPCVTVRPEAKERSGLLHRNHSRKQGLSLQDKGNKLTHLGTSRLFPIPKALAVVCGEGPSARAPLCLFSFIYGFSCFAASVFHLFPVSSLPLNNSPGFVPFGIFLSDLSDPADWQYWGSKPDSQSWGSEPTCVFSQAPVLGPASRVWTSRCHTDKIRIYICKNQAGGGCGSWWSDCTAWMKPWVGLPSTQETPKTMKQNTDALF